MSVWKNQRLCNLVKNLNSSHILCRKQNKSNDGATEEPILKPFGEIPGPEPLPLIGNIWRYFPVIGDYTFSDLYTTGYKKYKKFGPVVKEVIVPGSTVVWIFKPEDIEKVFRSEGKYPTRKSHLALEKYRKDRPHIYNTGGLLPTNGTEWARLRTEFQRGLSRPQNVRNYLPAIDKVMQEFITMLMPEEIKDGKIVDLLPELSRLFLELLVLITFNKSLQSLSAAEHHPNSKTSLLIESALLTNSSIIETDNSSQLWRYFETRKYKKLRKAQEYMERIALELMSETMKSLKNSSKTDSEVQCLFELFLSCNDVDYRDVTGMILDLLLAGIDTTTYTSCFALYHLSVNQEVQEKLFEESQSLLADSTSPVTASVLSKAQYTKSVLKETYRLNPISVGVGRILAQEAILSGYLIPEGTNIVTQNQISSRLTEYFLEPEKFMPERWLKNHEKHKPVHPYLVLPFGHGPRSCIARWFAEQHLQTLLLRIVRKYKMVWYGSGPLGVKTSLINHPDGPVLIKLSER